jgi:hypothetical protein
MEAEKVAESPMNRESLFPKQWDVGVSRDPVSDVRSHAFSHPARFTHCNLDELVVSIFLNLDEKIFH